MPDCTEKKLTFGRSRRRSLAISQCAVIRRGTYISSEATKVQSTGIYANNSDTISCFDAKSVPGVESWYLGEDLEYDKLVLAYVDHL